MRDVELVRRGVGERHGGQEAAELETREGKGDGRRDLAGVVGEPFEVDHSAAAAAAAGRCFEFLFGGRVCM